MSIFKISLRSEQLHLWVSLGVVSLPRNIFPDLCSRKSMKGRIAAGYEVHLLIVLWDPSGFAASIN